MPSKMAELVSQQFPDTELTSLVTNNEAEKPDHACSLKRLIEAPSQGTMC